MKRLYFPVFFILIVVLCMNMQAGTTWKKYVTDSFSFHYPANWQVKAQDTNIEISNPSNSEQLLIVSVPFDKTKSPTALAKQMIALFKQGMPDIKAEGFREDGGTSVYFYSTYTENKTPFRAEVLLLKDKASAFWFSYSAPVEGYNRQYALQLLQAFVGSIASGNASKPPSSDAIAETQVTTPNTGQNIRNSNAFLFVLEFALGAPFTHSQETIILDELLSGWKNESAESLKKYDTYPKLVAFILTADQHKLEELRKELEKTTRSWLNESDKTDKVVRIIRKQLEMKSKILTGDNPPLTEMAATAYAEMTAFANLLSENRNAPPSEISTSQVNTIRNLLQKNWNSFSIDERNDILTCPGLWITFRTLIRYGNATEKEKIYSQLQKLAFSNTSSSQSTGSKSSSLKSTLVKNMINHSVMMNINQQTFNHYMWSRGFKSTPFGY